MKQYRKVRVKPKGVTAVWEGPNTGSGFEDEVVTTFKGTDAPHQDLFDAMAALREDVAGIILASDDWMKSVRITTLSINREADGRRGLVITAVKELTNGPLVLNTPQLRERLDDDEGGNFLDDDTIPRVEAVLEGVEAYIEGKRQQLSLEVDEAA